MTRPQASLTEAVMLAEARELDCIAARFAIAADAWCAALDAIRHAQRMVRMAEQFEENKK